MRRFWTVHPSPRVRCAAMRVGPMRGKTIQGRKRFLLVDTPGFVIGANVLAAALGEREGGNVLLLPLAGKRPRLPVIWAERGENGAPFEPGVKACLGVRVEMVNHPWTGIRGVWATEGAVITGTRSYPKAFTSCPAEG